MPDSKREELKQYAEGLLMNVADELNVKEVILEKSSVYATYYYDTIKGENIGFKNDEEMFAALLFTGNVLHDMEIVRDIVNIGLRQRSEHKIKVRQPLQSITVNLDAELLRETR